MKKRIIAFCMAIVMLFSPLEVSAADEVVISPADLLAPALEDADLPELEEFGADHGTDTQILPLLASAEALVGLAAFLGLSAGTALLLKNSGMFSEWSTSLEAGFYQFCANTGIGAAAAVSWLADVAKGTLDKSSEVYKAFKQWVSGQYKASQTINELPASNFSFGIDLIGINKSDTRYGSGYYYYKLLNNGVNFFLEADTSSYLVYLYAWSLSKSSFDIDAKVNLSDDFSTVNLSASSAVVQDSSGRKLTFYYKTLFAFYCPSQIYDLTSRYIFLDSKFSFIPHSTASCSNIREYMKSNVLPFVSSTDNISAGQSMFAPANPAISQRWEKTGTLDDIDIQIGNDADAQVVNIPWQNVIDQYGSISAQLDAVQEGLISLDEAIAAVGAQVVDTTTDEVIAGGVETDVPAEDSKPDEGGGSSKPEQKPAAYAFDLTKYFPFCLPFDLYEFFTILAAEPEAPKFDFTLDLRGIGLDNYVISLDLKIFDGVAALIRTTELLLFIGSLITATRAMFIRS